MNKANCFLVVALAALASMLIARQELAMSFEFERWFCLSVSVFSGPLYALVMMWDEKKAVADVVFVFLVVVFAFLPFWIALKRKNILIFSIGAIVWVFIGHLMAIAIYI